MMRILQLGKFYPIRGGVEKVMWDLTRGLSAAGYTCDMLDQGAGAANVMHFRDDGKDMLLASNRETDEVALYTLDAEA